MANEQVRKILLIGMFGWLPLILLGLIFDMSDVPLYGWVLLGLLPIALCAAGLHLLAVVLIKCPACEGRYFSPILPYFVFRRSCVNCHHTADGLELR